MLPFQLASTTTDEQTTLQGMLDMQRSILLWKLDGLSEEDAKRPLVSSGTSLLGVVKHMVRVELWWFVEFIGGGSPDYPGSVGEDSEFRVVADETIASISDLYVDSVAQANEVIAKAESLNVIGSLPSDDPERRQRSLRWVLVHMIEETARHAGHLDIIRELIDDTTGYYPE